MLPMTVDGSTMNNLLINYMENSYKNRFLHNEIILNDPPIV